jgi:hypothetical protein
MLTLHAYMHSYDGPNLNTNRKATAFEVQGLPAPEQALVAEFNHRWKVLRITDGIYGDWSGRYGSVDEALATFQ